MTKPNTQFEELAREAAERIEAAKAAGEQLTFLPDEPQQGEGGRPPRGKGKATSQMREWLASKGFRLPEDVLAEMAGLASSEDAFLTAMARTEQVLAWAMSGGRDVVQVIKDGALVEKELDNRPTTGQRLATFQFVYTAQLRAVEALMPYGLAKVTPDAVQQPPVTLIVQGGSTVAQVPAQGPDQARDITGSARRLAPPPMPHEMLKNQQLAPAPIRRADDGARTE
jgi:hypothetical protein